MDQKLTKKYFQENAEAWLKDAYEGRGYSYPTAYHRMRITLDIIKRNFNPETSNLLDIGCGGGNLCIIEAQAGYQATGIDQSEEMIKKANADLASLPVATSSSVSFNLCKFKQIDTLFPESSYDAVTALGFIGYLENDEALFFTANKLIKKDGLFIVSCRNRLFNMSSISKYTIKEIQDGTALDLIEELEDLYQKINEDEVGQLISHLKETIDCITMKQEEKVTNSKSDGISPPDFSFEIEARQHTPKKLIETAKKHGFVHKEYYGVHPHLFIPRLNNLLTPKIFNQLSDCLLAFERLPISLVWSSVFIGVFQKQL